MTVRAVVLGILLGLTISAFCYFNDFVIQQTFLIGNHLPASVFGVGLLLVLMANPLLGVLGPRWPLKAAEVAVVLTLGLAVCAWPGSGLFRSWMHTMAVPGRQLAVQPSWQAARVMSYLPGGSPRLAPGFITDAAALAKQLHQAGQPGAAPARKWVRNQLPQDTQRLIDLIAQNGRVMPGQRDDLVKGLNAALVRPSFYSPQVMGTLRLPAYAVPLAGAFQKHALSPRLAEILNRAALAALFPGLIRPQPQGSGVLLTDGQVLSDVTESLYEGRQEGQQYTLWQMGDLPWGAWWPSIRLWGGAVVLMGLAALCMLVAVHPQWSQREVLPYPTVQFVEEVTARSPGRGLPDIASNRLFWIGLGVVAAVHLWNGWRAWNPQLPLPSINRVIDLTSLMKLFPNAARVPGSWCLFYGVIYPSVIGFGFFIQTRVTFSLGLSLVLWTLLGSLLMSFGLTLNNGLLSVGANGTALRFGAYVGMTVMILYFGRRHYFNVLKGMVGLPRATETPAYTVWAGRGMVLFTAGAVYLMTHFGGMAPLFSILFVLLLLMAGLVLARINVETGLFYCQPDWYAGTMLAGLFGLQGVGPTGLLLLLLASLVMMGDPREAIGPYLANGLQLSDRIGSAKPRATAPWMGLMIVAGFVVALAATLLLQYNHGLSTDGWPRYMPVAVFNETTKGINHLRATEELSSSTGLSSFASLAHASPDPTVLTWAAVGLVLVLTCALARLRLPWWPLHPVIFLIWGTYPAGMFAVSFLLAALVKWAVIRIGGERSYQRVKPLMVGLIAGDVLMIVVWSIIGAVIYLTNGSRPVSIYRILPI